MKNLILLFSVLIFAGLACNSSPSANTNTNQIDLSPKEFKAKMAEPNTIVLDVRTPAEIAQGKIPGSFDLDIQNPEFKACLLYTSPSPRDRTRSRMPSSA